MASLTQRARAQGYTTPEIVKQVKCSQSTVTRTRKETRIKDQPKKVESSTEYILLNSIYEMHLGIEVFAILKNEDAVINHFRDLAIKLSNQILKVNKELGRKALFGSEYFKFVMETLKTRPENLNKTDQQYRKKWINLLKVWSPEVLAEIV